MGESQRLGDPQGRTPSRDGVLDGRDSRTRGLYIISKEISQVDRSLILNSNSILYILVTEYYFQVLLVILVFKRTPTLLLSNYS